MNTTDTARAQGARQPPTCPTLQILFSDCAIGDGSSRALRPGRLAIGRDPPREPALRLPHDRQASRLHAAVHLDPSGQDLRIVDADSKNGTFVNGRRVQESALADGDLVRVADTFVLVRFQPARRVDAPIEGLVGSAPAVCALRAGLHLVAPTRASVLLLGESGTGKEVAARAVHRGSGRTGAFVAVNCSAIPESLAESQLFGHVAGAFTGARQSHPGLFLAADGGTLFLDEIGELPPSLQPKLLRALEERVITPLGAVKPVPCDARVVAATHQDLERAVAEGRFRGDLYARLAEYPLRLPPLRERREDILPLLQRALPRQPRLSVDLVAALLLHPWPYNVRELLKVAAQLDIRGAGSDLLDLDLVVDRLTGRSPENAAPDEPAKTGSRVPTAEELTALFHEQRGSVAGVARRVGRSPRQVRRWLTEYRMDANAFR